MTATSEERQLRAGAIVKEAASWASAQPWGLDAAQLREAAGARRRWRTRAGAQVLWVLATPRRRVTSVVLAAGLCALAVVAPIALAGGSAATQLRLASYSLRLPAAFHVTPYQQAMCWATTPLSPPRGGGGLGGTSPSVFATDAAASRCVMMTFLEPNHGTAPVPAHVLANDKPVRTGKYKGLIGSTYVRGAYGFNPGGSGGPYARLPRHGTFSETVFTLTLAVPVRGRLQTLEIVEHGYSQKEFLAMVAAGLHSVGTVPVEHWTSAPPAD